MVSRIGPKKIVPRHIYLREWREHRGLDQRQLAERLNTTEATISRYENLRRDPTLGFLEAAAEALNCSVTDIVGRRPPKQEEGTAPSAGAILGEIEDLLRRRQ